LQNHKQRAALTQEEPKEIIPTVEPPAPLSEKERARRKQRRERKRLSHIPEAAKEEITPIKASVSEGEPGVVVTTGPGPDITPELPPALQQAVYGGVQQGQVPARLTDARNVWLKRVGAGLLAAIATKLGYDWWATPTEELELERDKRDKLMFRALCYALNEAKLKAKQKYGWLQRARSG
jgi:hypothetical protein